MNKLVKTYMLPVGLGSDQVMQLPVDCEPLQVTDQAGMPRLWALVDPSAALQRRRVKLLRHNDPFADGENPDRYTYVGTVVVDSPPEETFHVFLGPIVA